MAGEEKTMHAWNSNASEASGEEKNGVKTFLPSWAIEEGTVKGCRFFFFFPSARRRKVRERCFSPACKLRERETRRR